jgi:hypothetical protein
MKSVIAGSLAVAHRVIFSAGIETDFLAFNSGVEASITVSERIGPLVHSGPGGSRAPHDGRACGGGIARRAPDGRW